MTRTAPPGSSGPRTPAAHASGARSAPPNPPRARASAPAHGAAPAHDRFGPPFFALDDDFPTWNDPIWLDPIFEDDSITDIREKLGIARARQRRGTSAALAAGGASTALAVQHPTATVSARFIASNPAPPLPPPPPPPLPPTPELAPLPVPVPPVELAPDAGLVRNQRKRWTGPLMADFLTALAATHNVTAAARHVGMTRQSAYALRARMGLHDNDFADAWDKALSSGIDALYNAMLHRAIHGTVTRHYYQGQHTHDSVRYDNRLAIHMLNAGQSARRQADTRRRMEGRSWLTRDWQGVLNRIAAEDFWDVDAFDPEVPRETDAAEEATPIAELASAHAAAVGKVSTKTERENAEKPRLPHHALVDTVNEDRARARVPGSVLADLTPADFARTPLPP